MMNIDLEKSQSIIWYVNSLHFGGAQATRMWKFHLKILCIGTMKVSSVFISTASISLSI